MCAHIKHTLFHANWIILSRVNFLFIYFAVVVCLFFSFGFFLYCFTNISEKAGTNNYVYY